MALSLLRSGYMAACADPRGEVLADDGSSQVHGAGEGRRDGLSTCTEASRATT